LNFTPSVYEHAARVLEKRPWEVSRDEQLLIQSHALAFEKYHHTPVIVGIDIYNLEPEAYGAKIEAPAGNGIPAISVHPFHSVDEILNLAHFNPQTDGRIPMILSAGKRLAQMLPEADVRIPVSGPFSIASNLIGFETLLMSAIMEPEALTAALEHLVVGQVRFCAEIARQGLDIAFFESSATPPLISPQMFANIVLPPLKSILNQAAAIVAHPVPCIIGGDTTPILESLLETGTSYVICPSETNQELFMKKMAAYPEVMVRINMDPGALTTNNLDIIRREADRVFLLAANREKVCLGTGVLPYETNPEVVLETGRYIQSRS
jgi:uroporphyrinogen decarboxylase